METAWQTWSDYCCHYFQQINRLQDCSPCLTSLWSMTAWASNEKVHQAGLQKAHLRWLVQPKGSLLGSTVSNETLSCRQFSRSPWNVVATSSSMRPWHSWVLGESSGKGRLATWSQYPYTLCTRAFSTVAMASQASPGNNTCISRGEK